MTQTIMVQMKRGGYVPMIATGHLYNDSDGSGRRWVECDDIELFWLGGGKVKESNIADYNEVIESYIEAVKNDRQY